MTMRLEDLEIRVLTAQDAAAFSRLRRERLESEPRAFAESIEEHDATPLETIAGRLGTGSGDNFVIGAFTPGGELVGMAGFSRSARLKARHKGIVWGVSVRVGWRRLGVARAVLTELLKRAREQGVEKVTLTVSTTQPAARRLYESLGFEVFGHELRALKVDGAYVDEDHMVRWLT